MTRASAPVSPLEYSGIQVDENEQIKAYKTSWLDRDNGRQKIITSYVRACQDLPFLDKKRLPHNFSHVIIGGNSGIFAAYTVDNFGNVSFLRHDYACLHAEADTVVFFAFKRFILNNPGTAGSSVVINCPEADNVTILLLEHQLISEVIENHDVSLYCTVHNKIVDAKTGKPTKKAKETATIEEFRSLGSKIKMDFYINVRQLYTDISTSDNFKNTRFAIESLGALNIFTGNDKSPGVRHVTKNLALKSFL